MTMNGKMQGNTPEYEFWLSLGLKSAAYFYRQQNQSAQEAPGGLEGEGAEIVHTHRLGHKGRAPDHRTQQQNTVADPTF